MGAFGNPDELGLEGTGVVNRVASDVKGLQPGDEVMMLSGGLFRTRVVVPARFCLKIPAGLAMDDAATMTSVYMTAMFCLCHLGRLREGDVSGPARSPLLSYIFADIHTSYGSPC